MYCSEKLYFSAGSEYHKMLFLKLLSEKQAMEEQQ